MKAKEGRPYSSPLRVEQAAATRERIVDAAVELLQAGDAAAVSMQDVADRAGVAVRTVYRAFPTRDDLIEGVLVAIKERFEASAGTPPATAEEFSSSIGAAVGAVFELEPLYRALFATQAGREAHRRSAGDRRAHVEAAFADELASLTPAQCRQVTAVMHLVTSSSGVLILKDYGGLDKEATQGAVSFAVAALMAALRDPELRAGIGHIQGDAP
ncbi:MAG TPA: TetR/AcrR family transcriptional regulator [Microthrixaceae bacterium]|nr:TetR/AcrR family transcriptional regulator [Microthrixaceae bacterium]